MKKQSLQDELMSVNGGDKVVQMCEYALQTSHIIRSYLKIDSREGNTPVYWGESSNFTLWDSHLHTEY